VESINHRRSFIEDVYDICKVDNFPIELDHLLAIVKKSKLDIEIEQKKRSAGGICESIKHLLVTNNKHLLEILLTCESLRRWQVKNNAEIEERIEVINQEYARHEQCYISTVATTNTLSTTITF
jgi:hypothetical protein